MNIEKKSLLLENDNMYLRTLVKEDVTEEYIDGLNDIEVNRYLVNVRRQTQTMESVEKFVVFNQEDRSSMLFGIFIKDVVNPYVGTVRISEMDFFHYSASIGICLFARRAWKKGYGSQSINLIKDYLFASVGLYYLEAGIYSENTNSINLVKRAGFSERYRVKNKFRHIDSFKDAIYFVAINTSFDMSHLNLLT